MLVLLVVGLVRVDLALATSVTVIFYDNRFGTINDATGAYSQVGTLPIGKAGGIAAANGLLYVEDFGNNLYSVDSLTGEAHLAGNTGLGLSLAAFGGSGAGLFEIDYQSVLYSINKTNGAATMVGRTGLAPNNGWDDTSLSSDGQYLYYTAGAGGAKDELYRIDQKTGVATDLGSTGQTGIAGSAFVNGSLELYQWGQARNYIYTSAITTGKWNFVQGPQLAAQIIDGGVVVSPGGLTLGTVSGLSGIVATPEPAPRWMAGGGLLALCWLTRRKRTRPPIPVR
jgi:hypothetical protein